MPSVKSLRDGTLSIFESYYAEASCWVHKYFIDLKLLNSYWSWDLISFSLTWQNNKKGSHSQKTGMSWCDETLESIQRVHSSPILVIVVIHWLQWSYFLLALKISWKNIVQSSWLIFGRFAVFEPHHLCCRVMFCVVNIPSALQLQT